MSLNQITLCRLSLYWVSLCSCRHAECHFNECHYVTCHFYFCSYPECHSLSALMLNIILLNVIFLSAIMLNVLVPNTDVLNVILLSTHKPSVIILNVLASPLTHASKFDSRFQLGICQSVYNAFLLILAKRPSLRSHGEDHWSIDAFDMFSDCYHINLIILLSIITREELKASATQKPKTSAINYITLVKSWSI